MNVGIAIKTIRKEKNLTQEQFANKVGMSFVYVGKIESGKGNPSIKMIEKISIGTNVPVPAILFLAMTDKDIATEKRDHFKTIRPSIEELIKTIM